jgi:aminoglycoside 6'-N-acetyltransferase I
LRFLPGLIFFTMIRVASQEDFPAIAQLAAMLWPSEDENILLGEFKANHGSSDHALYICEEKNEVIGFVELSLRNDYVEGTSSSPVAYIEAIFVKEQYRKQRIGIALVQRAEEWAREKGCRELASDTEISNITSQNFHKQCGFEEANRIVAFVKAL